jgi:hypothetical protein
VGVARCCTNEAGCGMGKEPWHGRDVVRSGRRVMACGRSGRGHSQYGVGVTWLSERVGLGAALRRA